MTFTIQESRFGAYRPVHTGPRAKSESILNAKPLSIAKVTGLIGIGKISKCDNVDFKWEITFLEILLNTADFTREILLAFNHQV